MCHLHKAFICTTIKQDSMHAACVRRDGNFTQCTQNCRIYRTTPTLVCLFYRMNAQNNGLKVRPLKRFDRQNNIAQYLKFRH